MIQIDTRNIRALEEFFDEQSMSDKTELVMSGFRKAVEPMVAAMKAGAPVGKPRFKQWRTRHSEWVGNTHKKWSTKESHWYKGGNLRWSITSKDIPDELMVQVGAFRPSGSHGHLNTRGTKERSYTTKKNGVEHKTGRMTARDFIKPAYNSTIRQVHYTVIGYWHDAIEEAINRANGNMI